MSWGRKAMAVMQNVTPAPHFITHWHIVRAQADIVIENTSDCHMKFGKTHNK